MFDLFRWSGASKRRNLATAEYEPVQPYFLIALATRAECVTFLDVGANIGAYSILASRIPSIRKIIAFEANPKAANEIAANSRLNGLDIEVHRKAASDRAGELTFGMVSDLAGNNAIVSSAMHGDFRRTVQVQAVRLDDLPELAGPICLKIDVEGHEAAVLAGAHQLLTARKCVIQIEGNRDEAGSFLEAIGYSRLTKIGPDIYYSNIDGLSVVEVYEQAMQALIDARHREKGVTVKVGDASVTLTGRTGGLARSIAKSLFGRRL